MSFLTLNFMVFLLITVSIFWCLPVRLRKYWILLTSYMFYASSDIRLLAVLFFVTLNVWLFGRIIAISGKYSKLFYILGFITNILLLSVFKYLSFLIENLNVLFGTLGISINIQEPNLFLPIGLSFIVFQATTYLGDVYHKRIYERENLVTVACFVAFFPTILSGPIQKARNLFPQLRFEKSCDRENIISGLLHLFFGCFQKIFIADALAKIVDPIFDCYQNYSSICYIVAAGCYSIQIYADFSAYSDIAKGSAALLGISLNKNFNNPYMSENLVDFWKNWHVSLNEWFVEYVYVPLGGNRKGIIRKYLNTFLVFVLSGLWHGASWNFVMWGIINGMLQIVGQILKGPRQWVLEHIGVTQKSVIVSWCRRIFVFVIISTTWIFFRVQKVEIAFEILGKIWSQGFRQIFDKFGWAILGSVETVVGLVLSLIVFVKVQAMRREEGKIVNAFCKEPMIVQYFLLAGAWATLILFLCQQFVNPNSAFIYFQF